MTFWLYTCRDVVVQTKYGQITERAVMESLYANTEIFGEVLDTWSDLLNHQELERDFGNSPYRLFLKVGVSVSLCSNLNSFLIHKWIHQYDVFIYEYYIFLQLKFTYDYTNMMYSLT